MQLKERLWQLIPAKQKELKEFNAAHGEKSLGNVTVGQVRLCVCVCVCASSLSIFLRSLTKTLLLPPPTPPIW